MSVKGLYFCLLISWLRPWPMLLSSSVCAAIVFLVYGKLPVGTSFFVFYGALYLLVIVIEFVSNCGLPRVDICTFLLYELLSLSSKFLLILLCLNVVNCFNCLCKLEGNCLIMCKWRKAVSFQSFQLEQFLTSFSVFVFRAL